MTPTMLLVCILFAKTHVLLEFWRVLSQKWRKRKVKHGIVVIVFENVSLFLFVKVL